MSDDIAGLSFEDAMAQLEAIVRDLESGKGKLDDILIFPTVFSKPCMMVWKVW